MHLIKDHIKAKDGHLLCWNRSVLPHYIYWIDSQGVHTRTVSGDISVKCLTRHVKVFRFTHNWHQPRLFT